MTKIIPQISMTIELIGRASTPDFDKANDFNVTLTRKGISTTFIYTQHESRGKIPNILTVLETLIADNENGSDCSIEELNSMGMTPAHVTRIFMIASPTEIKPLYDEICSYYR